MEGIAVERRAYTPLMLYIGKTEHSVLLQKSIKDALSCNKTKRKYSEIIDDYDMVIPKEFL